MINTDHRGWSRRDGARHELVCFASGLALVLAAVSPPVEHLSEDLVSLYMVRHVVLILIGALLIALSRPAETLLISLPVGARKTMGRLRASDEIHAHDHWQSGPALFV